MPACDLGLQAVTARNCATCYVENHSGTGGRCLVSRALIGKGASEPSALAPIILSSCGAWLPQPVSLHLRPAPVPHLSHLASADRASRQPAGMRLPLPAAAAAAAAWAPAPCADPSAAAAPPPAGAQERTAGPRGKSAPGWPQQTAGRQASRRAGRHVGGQAQAQAQAQAIGCNEEGAAACRTRPQNAPHTCSIHGESPLPSSRRTQPVPVCRGQPGSRGGEGAMCVKSRGGNVSRT